MIRGLDTTVRKIRRTVFEEVARLGFKADAETLLDDMEAIPYKIVNEDTRQAIFPTNIMSRRLCRSSRPRARDARRRGMR